jgi:hypothetical protein
MSSILEQLPTVSSVSVATILEREDSPTITTRFWSRAPGKFVNPHTGNEDTNRQIDISSRFTIGEWYYTLLETIIDASNDLHRRSLRGAAEFVVVPTEVWRMVKRWPTYKEATKSQKGSVSFDDAEYFGDLCEKYEIYISDVLPENKILLGRKGEGITMTYRNNPNSSIPEIDVKVVSPEYAYQRGDVEFWGFITILDMGLI